MPSMQYINRTAPFWDFIANLEEQSSSHPFFAANAHRGEASDNEAEHPNPWTEAWAGMPWGALPHRGRHGPPGGRRHDRRRDGGPQESGPEGEEAEASDVRGPPPPFFDSERGWKSGGGRHRHGHGRGFRGERGGPGARASETPTMEGVDDDQGEPRDGPPPVSDSEEGPRGGPRRHHGHGPHGGPEGFGGPGGRGGFGGHGGRGRHGGRGGRDFGSREFGGHGHGGRGHHFHPYHHMGPFGPLAAMFQNQMSNSDNTPEDFKPAADVFDTPDSYIVHVSLAGAKKEDVGVNWHAETSELSVAGVISRPGDEEFLKTLALDERQIGPFEKKVRLGSRAHPAQVDVDGITAKMENGVLTIYVPKMDSDFVEIKKVDIE